jgi:hypothetical protein
MPCAEDISKATSFASYMMKRGMPYGLAIHKASLQYNIEQKEIISFLKNNKLNLKKPIRYIYKEKDIE